jgi:hypothetical protein
MMRVLITILLVSLYAPQAAAAPSYLAMCHKDWNCKATLQTLAAQDAVVTGWIENTFNAKCPCGDKVLKLPNPKVIRVHLMNSPCMRNRRCGRYEVLYGYSKASASRAVHIRGSRLNRRFNAVLDRFKRRLATAQAPVQCYLSPCLECDLDGPARRALFNRVSIALPSCILVDNPYRQRCLRGFVCERHGHDVPEFKPCITDMDGLDGTTVSVRRWVANSQQCAIRYYWEPWMNCNTGIGDTFVDPRKRECGFRLKNFDRTTGILCRYFYPSSDICLR